MLNNIFFNKYVIFIFILALLAFLSPYLKEEFIDMVDFHKILKDFGINYTSLLIIIIFCYRIFASIMYNHDIIPSFSKFLTIIIIILIIKYNLQFKFDDKFSKFLLQIYLIYIIVYTIMYIVLYKNNNNKKVILYEKIIKFKPSIKSEDDDNVYIDIDNKEYKLSDKLVDINIKPNKYYMIKYDNNNVIHEINKALIVK